ncbi:MAG: discoidin domain-containing protein [Myxococcales bacterium]|nr:MAG: discoidin domain-containing protein [Myxococcales bacterium]
MFVTDALAWLRRAHQWVWRAEELRAARQAEQTDATAQAWRRARIAAEVAEVALRPGSPWLGGSAEHVAAGLFADALAWQLRARSLERGLEASSFAELLDQHRSELLEIAGSEAALSRLVGWASRRDFDSPLGSLEAPLAASELQAAARALGRRHPPASSASQRVLRQRALRTSALAFVLVTLVVSLKVGLDVRERRRDLARGKPWQASSHYEAVCRSPDHDCEGGHRYFFHTQNEDSPWLEVDLQRAERFTAIKVVNRRDCCEERAVPLVVEVSNDRTSWQAVAQRTEPFDEWERSFPAQTARWVRFRTTSRTFLHLGNVLVLR